MTPSTWTHKCCHNNCVTTLLRPCSILFNPPKDQKSCLQLFCQADICKSLVLFRAHNLHSLQHGCFHILTLTKWFWSHCNFISNKYLAFTAVSLISRLWVNTDRCFFRTTNDSFTFSLLCCPWKLLYLLAWSGDKVYIFSPLKHAVNTTNTKLSHSLPWINRRMAIFLRTLSTVSASTFLFFERDILGQQGCQSTMCLKQKT